MKITLKLFASLSIRLPAEARSSHCLELELDPGTTVLDVIRLMGLQSGECAIVLVDGVWVAVGDRATKVLEAGQALAIWPPVAGG
jgi:sulfur-carrier protein